MDKREYAAIQGATKESIARHQISGRHIGKVVDAYDGDTCRVAIAIPTWDRQRGAVTVDYINVRMLGYDAPEMKKKEQKAYGREVRAVFHALVLNKVVVLDIPKLKKPDAYGRVLAHMYAQVERGDGKEAERTAMDRRAKAEGGGGECGGGGTALVVRNRTVVVPVTTDVPCGYEFFDEKSLSKLLHVNEWMLENAHVKAYDGKGARGPWTADEIENGVEAAARDDTTTV